MFAILKGFQGNRDLKDKVELFSKMAPSVSRRYKLKKLKTCFGNYWFLVSKRDPGYIFTSYENRNEEKLDWATKESANPHLYGWESIKDITKNIDKINRVVNKMRG